MNLLRWNDKDDWENLSAVHNILNTVALCFGRNDPKDQWSNEDSLYSISGSRQMLQAGDHRAAVEGPSVQRTKMQLKKKKKTLLGRLVGSKPRTEWKKWKSFGRRCSRSEERATRSGKKKTHFYPKNERKKKKKTKHHTACLTFDPRRVAPPTTGTPL